MAHPGSDGGTILLSWAFGGVSSWIAERAPYSFVVEATDNSDPSLHGLGTSTISITAGNPTSITVYAPTTATSGIQFNVSIAAHDPWGNPYDGAMNLDVRSPQGGIGTYGVTMKNGLGEVNVLLNGRTGTTYTIYAEAGSFKSATSNITVFNSTSSPPPPPGAQFYKATYDISAYHDDDLGNPQYFDWTQSFTDYASNLAGDVNYYTDELYTDEGYYQIVTVLISSTPISSLPPNYIPSNTGYYYYNPGSVDPSFILSAADNSGAGSPTLVTVTALDASGDVNTDYTGTVYLTSSDPQAGPPASYTFTASDQGNHTFSVTLETGGEQAITATDGAGLSGTTSIYVTADAITATSGGGQSAGINNSFTSPLVATATDASGNPMSGVTIIFAGPANGAGVTFPNGNTAVTNAQGQSSINVAANGIGGTYNVTAHSSASALATFSLTNTQPPAITSSNTSTFTAGRSDSFTVTTSGFPLPSLTESGALPSGVTLVDNGNGTATLGGAPSTGTQGTYQFTIMAHNGVGSDATQSFMLTVNPAPAVPPPPPAPTAPAVPPPPAAPNVLPCWFCSMNFWEGLRR